MNERKHLGVKFKVHGSRAVLNYNQTSPGSPYQKLMRQVMIVKDAGFERITVIINTQDDGIYNLWRKEFVLIRRLFPMLDIVIVQQ